MLIVLDSGPLGLMSNPTARGPAHDAQVWARTCLARGDRFVVPEIADYEVRRELVRAGKDRGIARLDELCRGLGYLPLSTGIMRSAATLWAHARNAGLPSAHDAALDGDVILAAQAASIRDQAVVVATTNVSHLERYTDVRLWSAI